jgi:hypothetical protein
LQSFEAQMLAEDGNFSGLARLNRKLVGKAEAIDSHCRTVLGRIDGWWSDSLPEW